MKCPRCQHENDASAKFCEECAAPFARVCAKCGRQVSPTAKFCPECAHPTERSAAAAPRFGAPESYTPQHLAARILTSKSALEGERKQVTVLFADLKGSMELLADRDPEEARKILDPVLEHMMEAVHRFEGTVNQVMGDGIMALFGAPLAHEDHAVRACYAALRMQRTVQKYAEGIRREEGVLVQIRVGLNSGEVIVRSIGSDLHMDYTAVGQTTHLAARMEQLAAPGSATLTGRTLDLAEGFIEVKPLGPMTVKGLAEPVPVFELAGTGSVRSRLQAAAARGLSRFVGRDGEMDQLRRSLELARNGRGQVAAIVGEPGVGKSRLVFELTHSHRVEGWLILESRSVSYGKANSYLPVIELLKDYFRVGERDTHREIREKIFGKIMTLDRALEPSLPAFLALLDVPVDDDAWRSLDPDQRRRVTLDAVKRFLLREAQSQPLLVVFEDLHWIDSETQAVLDSLVESLPALRLFLLVNYRPEYTHAWGSKGYYGQVRLDTLAGESANELLDALLGHDSALAPVKTLLAQKTGGNPLFIEEGVRSLVETHALAGTRGAYHLARAPETIQVPATVQAILAARIDRLPAEQKQLLQCAAVIGKDVPLNLLEALADDRGEDLRRSLAQLQAAEFLYETVLFPDTEYTFKHALTHDVAYGSLLHERRRALHRRIVEAIEATHADRLIEQVERLAHHALRGEDWDKAVRYGHEAGRKSLERSANQEATAYFKQALAALERLPDARSTRERSVDLRFDLYHSMLPLDELQPILEYLRVAETLASALADQRRQGWAWLHICHILVLVGDCAEGVEFGRRAVGIANAIDDIRLRIIANLWIGCALYALGDHASGIDLLREALAELRGEEQAGRAPLLQIVVTVRSYLSMFLAELGEFREAAAMGEEAMAVAEAMNRPWARMLVRWQVGEHHLVRGELDAASALLERGLAIGQQWGFVRTHAVISCGHGYAMALAGRAADAVPLVEANVKYLDGINFTWLHGRRLTFLGEAYLLAGRLTEAKAQAERALQWSRDRKERGFEAWVLRLLAEIAMRTSPAEDATAGNHFQQALSLGAALGMRPLVAHCHAGLARVHRRAGQTQQAHEHFEIAASMYCDMEMTYWLEKAERERADR
jgi:class 3 adenylate cyclase/tetratricopeptide (TPR) repeat protein